MIEGISGPIRGYYVAAYACPVGEHGSDYIGYYKVYARPPGGFFDDTTCLLKGTEDVAVHDAQAAVQLAINCAQRQVENMPPAQELAACREQRRLYFWELADLGLSR